MPTPLQNLIIHDLQQHGPSTSKQIADRLQLTTRSVSSSLMFLRGDETVTDGSIYTPFHNPDGTLAGYAYDQPNNPIIWSPEPYQPLPNK